MHYLEGSNQKKVVIVLSDKPIPELSARAALPKDTKFASFALLEHLDQRLKRQSPNALANRTYYCDEMVACFGVGSSPPNQTSQFSSSVKDSSYKIRLIPNFNELLLAANLSGFWNSNVGILFKPLSQQVTGDSLVIYPLLTSARAVFLPSTSFGSLPVDPSDLLPLGLTPTWSGAVLTKSFARNECQIIATVINEIGSSLASLGGIYPPNSPHRVALVLLDETSEPSEYSSASLYVFGESDLPILHSGVFGALERSASLIESLFASPSS